VPPRLKKIICVCLYCLVEHCLIFSVRIMEPISDRHTSGQHIPNGNIRRMRGRASSSDRAVLLVWYKTNPIGGQRLQFQQNKRSRWFREHKYLENSTRGMLIQIISIDQGIFKQIKLYKWYNNNNNNNNI
jgi:hypothetical protein